LDTKPNDNMPTRPFFLLFHLLLWGSTTAQPDALPPEMVFVQGGTFEMGCTPEQTNCGSHESPVHEVTLTDFYIGKYEVTQAQWAAIVPEYAPNYSQYGQGDTHPAYRISWYDAVTFCNRLSQQEGYTPVYYFDAGLTEPFDSLVGSPSIYVDIYQDPTANGYRLPTEAEWEYAARGGAQSGGYQYSGSDDINEVAWYAGNDNSQSEPAGTKAPNELGVYDMSGNVWEWCWDWHDSSYYGNSPSCAPLGPTGGSNRVPRGGSWSNAASNCRVANRYNFTPGFRVINFGFRLSRTP
jgi:formylglycine-generating enzyme required for sulfatase activity